MATLETDLSTTRQWLDLSLAQRAVWLDASLAQLPTAYILIRWAHLQGEIDAEIAHQALTLTVARHDALRLRVDTELPRQWLHTSSDAPLPVVDLSNHPNPEETLDEYLKQVSAKGMPLGDRWLFSLELIKLGSAEYYLLARCHHLLADETAVAMILGHWLEAYRALTSDSVADLSLPSSYVAVVASDLAYADSPRYKQDLAYWVSRFKSLSPKLIEWRAADASPAGSTVVSKWVWNQELYASFLAACAKAGATPQRVIFALVNVLFFRRHGQSDLTIGMALHRRDASNFQVVGMLAGMVAIRSQIDESATLLESVQAISSQVDRDLRHQRLPIDALTRGLGISRDGLTEIFQIAFSFVPADRGAQGMFLDGVDIQTGGIASPEASPVTIHAYEGADKSGLTVDISAHSGVLDLEETDRLLNLFRLYVDQFMSDPDEEVMKLPGVTLAERSKVISEWNATARASMRGRVEDVFRKRARETPNAIALISSTESLTYAELDAQSGQLANLLLLRGVEHQSTVGVALERSVSTVVSILAVLKAGCIYLPLDPAYPPDRLAHMLSDSGARIVITDAEIDSVLPAAVEKLFIDNQSDWKSLSVSLAAIAQSASEAAYIIYTSGSTGKPKGVAVPHTAAANLAFGRLEHDPISVGDRVLAAISVGFDVSIGQLLLPLLSGATIVIAGDLRTLTAQEFWHFVNLNKVTHINSVPSFFESILDAVPESTSLVRLMLGGEPLSSALVRRLRKALPATQLFNMYGPTEACIDATAYQASGMETVTVLPIGKPLPNYRAYILNDYLEPVGIGIAGDLYLAGTGLAHAYIHQPALTAERFIADPFGRQGDRLYRTGDRARWKSDGNIDFLGRADSQVKIRGHRIELGEIEASLLLHPAVAQAVVVANTDAPGAARLVAYVVLHAEAEAGQLRSHLATHVPEYMIPSAFCVLPALPLTANGKLDQRSLPAVKWHSEKAHVQPRTETEQLVCNVFAELLGVHQVGVTDNFFELGGHSLLATRMVSQLRSQFHINIPLRTVFENPTVEAIARYLETADKLDVKPFTAAPIPEFPPLSFTQERFWFLSQLQKNDTYNVPVAVRLRGLFATDRAVAAISEIVRRHEVLRTRIVLQNGVPIQQVQESSAFRVPLIELGSPEALEHHLNQLAHLCFDLSSDFPIKAEIISIAADHHVLAAVIHHAAFDGWSANLFFMEFGRLYSGHPLPELTLQYADVAVWQRQQNFSQDLAYWKQNLAGAPPILEFPAVRIPAGLGSGPAGIHPIELEARFHNGLLSLAQENGVSLFMVLHAAFAVMLSRWSGQTDIVIGTVVANRAHAEFHSLIGCFVNTLSLRTQLGEFETFTQILARIRADDLSAYDHQSLPFEKLVDELQPERSLSQTPIFQVMLVLQSQAREEVQLPGLLIEPYPLEPGPAKFNLTLNLGHSAKGDGLAGCLEYATDLYDAAFMQQFATEWLQLLQLVCEKPDVLPLQVNLFAGGQRHQIVSECNATGVAYPTGRAEQFFVERAVQTPAAIAVVSAAESVTYSELHSRSNQLANALLARGIARQSVIGVALERSVATVVSLLAILKAGCTYLPLDPAYPADRIAHMISDSAAKLVITSPAILETLPVTIETVLVNARETLLNRDDAPVYVDCSADDAAYIIYTSGSTGKPKGVAVPHKAAVNLAFARLQHDPVSTGDRILAAISVGFDVSIGQLLLPLLSGATVVIAGDLRNFTPTQFWEFLNKYHVTHINSVPSFFESVLEQAPLSTSLIRLMLGGEPLSSNLIRRLRKALPHTEVFNMYGPTEACIDATSYRSTGDELSAFLPIGKPLPNYRAYILNRYLEPVSVGVTGDLYLGGAGLAHAYINQSAMTADRFIADPFTDKGDRLYKTGDRARWLSDGNIDFLGRADNQVKIRGHRIELGEIESSLLKQPGVQEAAVIVREDIHGEQRLVAYYRAGQAISADVLHTSLSRVLPGYMVPAAYVPIPALPLTPNGKLDRKALPLPGADAYAARVYEEPHGAAEQKIANIFAQVLKINQVGRHDNFFELGGHSLLAMTVIELMRQSSLHVDVRHLFTSPTAAGLANVLSLSSEQIIVPPNLILDSSAFITPDMLPLVKLSQAAIDAIAGQIPGGVSNIQDIYPLAPLQEGILFHHLMSKTGDAYLTPFLFGFDSRERLDSFLLALNDLVSRHDVLRTAVLWEGLPDPVQVVLRSALLPVEVVSVASNSDAAEYLREKYHPGRFRIDVRQAPMMRAYISWDEVNQRWLLLLMSHHLILDHTSMEVILQEVGLISSGLKASLPEVMPFRHFVAQAKLGVSQQEHEAFFRDLLGDVQETTAPYGLTHVQGDGEGIIEFTWKLDPALSKRVRDRCRALGIGPAAFFHLAWSLVLAHLSGQREVVFGTLLLGRLQSGGGLQRTLGLFINTLPFRVKIDAASVVDALQRTHQNLADLIRHENTSLALAQRCSGVPSPAPLFSSLFNFRQSPPPSEGGNIVLPGVELVYARERTDYPVAIAVDDHTSDFSVTAQSDTPADPVHLCRYVETAINSLISSLENKPDTPLHRVNVLPKEQYGQVISAWNDTETAYPPGNLAEVFAQQVANTPNAIAVVYGKQQFTYAELNHQSEEVANLLIWRGVTAETVVGVALPRSAGTVISLMAILKIGAIYLPLDPAYPPDRISYMFADSGASLVIANTETESLLAPAINRINLDLNEKATERVKTIVRPDFAAYIIYTSGSTGKPKGVTVSHASAVNLAFGRRLHDPITIGDRILAAISVGFDVSIGQLLLPLLSGATIVIASDLRTLTPHDFWDFLAENRVTHINSVPSFFESILDAAPKSCSLIRLMLGGESLTPLLVRRLQNALPSTQVVNMYGPTEACIDATCYVATGSETQPVLPIGKPLPNYQAYILNEFLDPVGVGVAGDLYLGGAGLARAYINQPALTAERFIANPFGTSGQRIYRTGDRARWRADGNIDFLGRGDHQVKIRGHRIELGEIESALLLHSSLAQAVVVPDTNKAGSTRLVAYLVPKHGELPAAQSVLRDHLASHLPEYMIPALFVTLEALPLTRNGKVDLKALPQPASDRMTDVAYEPAATDTELAMEKLWQMVLGVDRIGIHDDFFALGGHSLAVMRLISLCNSQFKTNLALRSLFDNPTIAKISRAIDTNTHSTAHPSLVSLRSTGSRIPLFCIHPAGGAVLRYVPLTNSLHADQPVYGLQARGLLEGEPLGKSMEEMAADYITAIRSVQPEGPYQLLGWSSGGMVGYEMAQQLKRAGETVSFLGLMDTSLPDKSKRNPSEQELMHAFATTFGYEDLLKKPRKARSGDELQDRIVNANRLPQGLDAPQFKRFYNVFCNTLTIYPHYVPQAWQGPFVMFRALKRSNKMPDWSKLVSRNANYIDLDCTHADLPSETMAPILAAHIEPILRESNYGK